MLKRNAPLRPKGKQKSAAMKRHHDAVAAMGCLVCNADAELHHVRGYADKAGAISKDDRLVTPLCPTHHRYISPNGIRVSVHDLGHRGFYQEHGVDLFYEAESLWAESVEIETRKDAA